MEKLIAITAVNEIDREQPYTAETFREVGAKRLQRLKEIRTLLESEDYEEKLAAFEEERDRLTEGWQRYTEHVGDWEMQITEQIMSDPTLSEEEKRQKLQSEVYPKVQEMLAQAESSEGYKSATDAYRAFLQENELMDEATGYRLERTSPEVEPFFDLAQALTGEEPDMIDFEMPSDCIYDQIALWEEYVESGYLEDFNKAAAEDERAKQLSAMQLNYLFSASDTVCFHAEQCVEKGEELDTRFAELLDGVYRTEETENYGMQVLRIYLKPTKELKSYLLSFKRFDRYHYDAYERYDPYVSFADIAFLKDGKVLLSCLTHEGYFDVSDEIKPTFDQLEEQAK